MDPKSGTQEFFNKNFLPQDLLVRKIKEEARCWVLAGAKHLGAIREREE
jgi:hypothetical protein